jgi:hypothetical protein
MKRLDLVKTFINYFFFQNTKLEAALIQSEKQIENNQEKQVLLIIERDRLSEQINEKQTLIESMMKVRFLM